MKFLANQRLATRISIITTAITLAGMLLLTVATVYPTTSPQLSKTTSQTR